MLGIGRKHRVDIYIGTKEFKKRNNDELDITPGDLFFLNDKIYDPVVGNDGKIIGWFKAKRFDDDDDRPVVEWDLVPSNCVRKTTKTEKAQAIEGCVPKWTKMYDPRTIRYYYYNNYTGEILWEEPKDYVPPPKSSLLRGLSVDPKTRAVIQIQNAYRSKQARKVIRVNRALSHKHLAIKGWLTEHDPQWKCNYYFHVDDLQMTWDKPQVLREIERKERQIKKSKVLKQRDIIVTFFDEGSLELRSFPEKVEME